MRLGDMADRDETTIVDHLEAALEETEDDEALFHIRQALQHLGQRENGE